MSNVKTSISPWISVENSAKAGAFYKKAFDAVETYRMETPDGGLVLRLSVNGAEFWVSGNKDDPERSAGNGGSDDLVRLILTVEDPNEVFDKAIKSGAVLVTPMAEGHGWLIGRLKDPFGLHWELGKPLSQ